MFAISVVLTQHCFQLLFQDEKKARSAEEALKPNPMTALGSTEWVNIQDDFGHELACDRKSVTGYIYEDWNKSKLAHVERAIQQQRTQVLAQKHADSDPALRASRMMAGPPLLSPFPQNGPGRN